MNVIIRGKKLKGDVYIMGSKSITHRAIICASLSRKKSIIRNVTYSDDILATIKACRAFGATISKYDDYLEIVGSQVRKVKEAIDCNESGSTLRFMIPILMTCEGNITFTGQKNLVNRPIDVYTNLFDKHHIKYSKNDKQLPITIHDTLKPNTYKIKGSVSSQFISGLLFALPLLKDDSKIILTSPLVSKGYVDITIDVMNKYGINIINNDYSEFIIKGNQEYKSTDFTVEGDYSQAAFFLVANALGSNIKIHNLNESSLQGDKKVIEDIKLFGPDVNFIDNCLTVKQANLVAATIDFEHTPDIAPIMALLASVSSGESRFLNIARLRIKECNRAYATVKELTKLGAMLLESENEITIKGVSNLKVSFNLDSHNDHRIVMMLVIASTIIEGKIRIKDINCINKSYPNFFEILEELGAEIKYEY